MTKPDAAHSGHAPPPNVAAMTVVSFAVLAVGLAVGLVFGPS